MAAERPKFVKEMPVSRAELVKNERRNYGNPLFPVFLMVGHDCMSAKRIRWGEADQVERILVRGFANAVTHSPVAFALAWLVCSPRATVLSKINTSNYLCLFSFVTSLHVFIEALACAEWR